MEQLPASFWQANLWGIVGTVTGLAGMLISWLSFKYNTPKIEIDKMSLVIPNWAARDWKGKQVSELKNNFLDFDLEIMVRNTQGGAGSIDKPNLLIKIPVGKRLFFLKNWESIILLPQTQHTESERKTENMTEIWTVRHGRAFNLGGGEKADENLKYDTDKAETIYKIVQNFERLQYFIEYMDNHGKRYEKKIERIFNESDRDRD